MSDETKPTADEDEAAAKPAALITYVVQIQGDITTAEGYGNGTEPKDTWIDIATVQVPPRTKRRTVIEKALAVAKIEPGEIVERLRALDVDSAEVHPFEPHQPDPEWRAA